MDPIEDYLKHREAEVDAQLATGVRRLTVGNAEAMVRAHPVVSLGGGAALGFLAVKLWSAAAARTRVEGGGAAPRAAGRVVRALRPLRAAGRLAAWIMAMSSPMPEAAGYGDGEAGANPAEAGVRHG